MTRATPSLTILLIEFPLCTYFVVNVYSEHSIYLPLFTEDADICSFFLPESQVQARQRADRCSLPITSRHRDMYLYYNNIHLLLTNRAA
jgi:hypothetical protein